MSPYGEGVILSTLLAQIYQASQRGLRFSTNTKKWTVHTCDIDVGPPTFIFVCIFSREILFFMTLFGIDFPFQPPKEGF